MFEQNVSTKRPESILLPAIQSRKRKQMQQFHLKNAGVANGASLWQRLIRQQSRRRQGDNAADATYIPRALARISGEYAGAPIPMTNRTLVFAQKNPMADAYQVLNEPKEGDLLTTINYWYGYQRREHVYICKNEAGKSIVITESYPHHLSLALRTTVHDQGWDIQAEVRALSLLRSLISPNLFVSYLMTGIFLETSKRSHVTYLFRRLRPTVAIRGDQEKKAARILCCLCLHPLAYYEETWAGALCPTDDVIASLLLMRSDEHFLWKKSNQIAPWEPEAGL